MMQVRKCPSCGAQLKFDSNAAGTCNFCGSRLAMSMENTFSEEFSENGLTVQQEQKLREILSLAHSRRKIEAIKVYRETFGVGLKEAKDAVEKLQLEGEINANFRDFAFQKVNGRFIAKQGANTGCALIFLAAIGLIITIVGIKVFI